MVVLQSLAGLGYYKTEPHFIRPRNLFDGGRKAGPWSTSNLVQKLVETLVLGELEGGE